MTEDRDAVAHERDEALERVRLLEAEVERVTAREDATRRELSETRIDMRDAQRERDEARAEVGRLREMAHDFEAMREDRDSAYRRGAEEMRLACQQWCRAWENNGDAIADALADLRVEDKP